MIFSCVSGEFQFLKIAADKYIIYLEGSNRTACYLAYLLVKAKKMVTFKLVKKASYKVVGDMKVSSREGLVISYLDEAPDLFGMSSKLVCEGQIYNYSSSVFDSWNAIVINSPESFVGKVISFIPEGKTEK